MKLYHRTPKDYKQNAEKLRTKPSGVSSNILTFTMIGDDPYICLGYNRHYLNWTFFGGKCEGFRNFKEKDLNNFYHCALKEYKEETRGNLEVHTVFPDYLNFDLYDQNGNVADTVILFYNYVPYDILIEEINDFKDSGKTDEFFENLKKRYKLPHEYRKALRAASEIIDISLFKVDGDTFRNILVESFQDIYTPERIRQHQEGLRFGKYLYYALDDYRKYGNYSKNSDIGAFNPVFILGLTKHLTFFYRFKIDSVYTFSALLADYLSTMFD